MEKIAWLIRWFPPFLPPLCKLTVSITCFAFTLAISDIRIGFTLPREMVMCLFALFSATHCTLYEKWMAWKAVKYEILNDIIWRITWDFSYIAHIECAFCILTTKRLFSCILHLQIFHTSASNGKYYFFRQNFQAFYFLVSNYTVQICPLWRTYGVICFLVNEGHNGTCEDHYFNYVKWEEVLLFNDKSL